MLFKEFTYFFLAMQLFCAYAKSKVFYLTLSEHLKDIFNNFRTFLPRFYPNFRTFTTTFTKISNIFE